MKTKLLLVCLFLIIPKVYSEENPDGLVNINPIYTDNICDREISKLKKYESVLCEVFRYEFFKYRDRKIDRDAKYDEVLDNIIDMIYNPTFQEKLKHSTPREIDQRVQAFLA